MIKFLKNFFYLVYSKLNFFTSIIIFKSLNIKKLEDKSIELEILSNLRDFGFSVVENYLDKNKCEQVIKKIDLFIDANPNKIWSGKFSSDQRIHGAEHIDDIINEYHNSKMIINVGSAYLHSHLTNFMTMANRTKFFQDNLGSGEGWHRDSLNTQFKSILYLVDVDYNNGPFQMIKDSQKFFQILKDSQFFDKKIYNTRFSDNEISALIKKSNVERLLTFSHKAGTLLIVDTSNLHRGSPIVSGNRYALTNYYYPIHQIENYKNHFVPMLTKNDH